MADKKISQLTSATTPLAGTEVLPIVQNSNTVKVATNDLTVKNVRSNATTGILQVAGPAAAATRVMTVPDADFTAARTDAAQTFTGAQTFSAAISVGNATPSASGAGVTFPASQSASTNANTLDDYEEGTFTPVISGATSAGAGTYTLQQGRYTKVGRLVTVNIGLTWTAHTGTGRMLVAGLPFVVANAQPNVAASVGYVDNLALTANNVLMIYTQVNSDYFNVYQTPTGGGAATDVPMDTAATLVIAATYAV